MASADYIDSWYTHSATLPAPRAALAQDIDCDVCVVGGGIAGTSTALHLAQAGRRVVLLEARRVGWGASGRSGGQAIFGVAAGESKLERELGDADSRRIFDVTVEGLSLMQSLIGQHGIDCDWVTGQMHVAIKRRQETELLEMIDGLARRYDYHSLRFVPRDEVRATIASERYIAGVYDSLGGHLHPLKYTLGLAAAAERAGVSIFEHTRALDYGDGATVRVRTERGDVRCRDLVLCGNADLGRFAPSLAPTLARRIMAVGTYIVATEPLGADRARALIGNDAAVTDINWVLDYFRLTRDHRLLFGGRVSYSGLDPLGTARATRARMLQVFPQLADVQVESAWGGAVDITMSRAPDFGRLAKNVWYLQGFSGHGIVLTGIAGKLVADAIRGTTERFDIFTRLTHREFPGGAALRRPALVLAMLWYRLRDLL